MATDRTIAELIRDYRDYVKGRYVKNGRPTSEQADIASAMKHLRVLYGNQPVNGFGPLALKAVRLKMIEAGWARMTINTPDGYGNRPGTKPQAAGPIRASWLPACWPNRSLFEQVFEKRTS